MSNKRPKIPHDIRLAVYQNHNWACVHCGYVFAPRNEREATGINAPVSTRINKRGVEKECQLQIDHIHPRALGGTDMVDNFQALCSWCNRRKLKHTVDADWDTRFAEAARILETGPPSLQAAQHAIEALAGQRLYIKSSTGNDYNQIGDVA